MNNVLLAIVTTSFVGDRLDFSRPVVYRIEPAGSIGKVDLLSLAKR